ncbi:MAG TPA: DUF6599 family protein [Thermoanaerobaculaceae bacterium]|nr:DUF6599 family protein [Thermoanaerobaculaceae bacterium]
MKRLRPWHPLLLLPLAAVAGWVAARGRATVQDPAAVLLALRSTQGPRLPDAVAVGAAKRSEPASYDRETLYEYIDGAAEGYLARGFQRCLAASYGFVRGGAAAVEVDAELYRFSQAKGARGQLEAERPAAATPVGGLADAWCDASTLVAVRGADYLKLTAFAEGGARPELEAIARAWAKEAAR